MSKTIQTIDLFRWSEPDEQRRVTHIGMANAKEVFNKLEAHLKENNLLPDEYFLFTENNFLRTNGELPMDTADITYEVKYGGSEGIYLDINIRTADYKQIHFATGKTLGESTDDFLRMSRIGAECSLMLNNGGYKIEMKETPEITFKLKPEEETLYSFIDKSGNDTLLKRATLKPENDSTPFIIASGVKTEDSLISWDSGRYFSSLKSAMNEFQQSIDINSTMKEIKQDQDKICRISELLEDLTSGNRIYSDMEKGSHFNYDGIIELLEKATNEMNSTVRTPRPDNIAKEMAWSEKFYDPDEEFNPFVYDGSMSIEDFEKVETTALTDSGLAINDTEDNITDEYSQDDDLEL